LELGIDIGAIDQVVQVGSPGGVARLLQRVGRAGHSPGATSRGVVVSRGGVDLLECALLAKLALRGALEPVRIPRGALDVLAQQLVATAAAEPDGIALDDFLAMARRAYPYRALSRETVLRVVEALASGHLRAPRLEWDRSTGKITTPDSAKKIARMSGGTITSRGLYRMLDADTRETIGELDEEFVHESKPGDRFSFGLGVYRIASIRPDAVLVRRAPPGSARMPFWRGDRPMRAASTGVLLGQALDALEPDLDRGEKSLRDALQKTFPITGPTAEALGDLLVTQWRATRLPTDRTLVVETFQDQLGEPRIAIHCWLGRSVLEPWALAIAARMESRLGGAVHAVATDNGLLIAPPKGPPYDAAGVPRMVSAREIRALVETLLPRTAVAGAAFREAAERSLLLPRMPFKKRTPLWMNRQRARDLLLAIGDDPNHPIVAEALRDVMNDRWDTAALEAYLARIDAGSVTIHHVDRKTPSLFARGLEEAFKFDNLYEDDTPSGERLARRASSAQGHDAEGTFESPLDLVGLAEPSDRGVLAGLAPELPLTLMLLRAQGPIALDDLARHLATTEDALRERLAEPVAKGEIVVGRFIDRPPGDLSLEVTDSEVLARLRRRALSRARRQVEPVSRRAYQRWLLERMAVGPFAGEGDEAVVRSVAQLAMYPTPPECLERDLLRVRVQRYEPALIDLACARGEVRYVLLEDPARIVVAPASTVTPFPPATSRVSGEWAERVRDVLRERGALFFGDIVLASRLPVADASDVLARMLRAGEVTNDAFVPARTLATGAAGKGTPVGRYALRASVPVEPSVDALIERLLARYGVVARPLVDLEELAPSWGAMREELDRREARGEVRRGAVVDGLGPVQFARTETIEALRATRSDVLHAPVLLSARDPALVAEVSGIGRSSTTRVVVRDGEPFAVCERDGAVIRTLRDLDPEDSLAVVEALRALARLPAVLRPFRALTVERVDDRPASESVLADALRAQGFERDGERMGLPSFRG
jgi:ATP-dependent Lhr-like helicase